MVQLRNGSSASPERAQFIKIKPVMDALAERGAEVILVQPDSTRTRR